MTLRRAHRLASLPLLATLAILPACDRLSGSDEPEQPANDHTLADSKGRWKGLSARCPVLSSAAATALGVAGEGVPSSSYVSTASILNARCDWASQNTAVTAVTVEVDLYRRPEGAETQWGLIRELNQDVLPGLGDEAGALVLPPGYTVRVRSGNAVVIVKAEVMLAGQPAGSDATIQGMKKTYGADMAGLAADVLDDLR